MTTPTRHTSEFPADLSHELRNALACIRQFGNILIDGLAGELSGEQLQYLGIIIENAATIRTLLDSALDGTSSSIGERTSKIKVLSKLEV